MASERNQASCQLFRTILKNPFCYYILEFFVLLFEEKGQRKISLKKLGIFQLVKKNK